MERDTPNQSPDPAGLAHRRDQLEQALLAIQLSVASLSPTERVALFSYALRQALNDLNRSWPICGHAVRES